MKLESKRLFIPNLPEGLSEDEVRKKFFKYGNVSSIELKERKELGPKNWSHSFAYVNIDTDHGNLKDCFTEFNAKKWNGHYVAIQEARESFLERLRRERLETQQSEEIKTEPSTYVQQNINSKPLTDVQPSFSLNGKLNKKTFNSDSDDSDNTSEEDIKPTIKKVQLNKKAENCIENDNVDSTPADYSEIVVKNNKFKKAQKTIESVGNQHSAITYNDNSKKVKKSKDPYRQQADNKRLNSMMQMKKDYQQQKTLIQAALSNVEKTKSNKIIFDDDGKADNFTETQDSLKPTNGVKGKDVKQLSLFDNDVDDDSDEETNVNNFELKKQFQGKKGKELFELQARFNHDKRFQIDERFINKDDEEEEQQQVDEDDIAQEKRKEYEILGEVLGKKFEPKFDKSRKTMRRFDPSEPEHSKYLITEEATESKKKKKKVNVKAAAPEREILPVVSQEVFYEVTDTLKEALEEAPSFSILSTFGRDTETDKPEVEEFQTKEISKSTSSGDAFKYDSSDDEKSSKKVEAEKQNGVADDSKNANVNLGPGKLWTESLFFKYDDYRLQEGLEFIHRRKEDEEENFEAVRDNIKKIAKRKALNVEKKQTNKYKKRRKTKKA